MYCIRNIIYFICIIILSISCSNIEEEPALQAPSSAAFSVSRISGPNRISKGEYTGKNFGVYAIASGTNKSFYNCEYSISWTNTDTNFPGILNPVSEEITYPTDNTPMQFYAYYPYKKTMDGTDTDPIYTVDWRLQDESVDLLVADGNAKGQASSPNVGLTFRHKFCKIILDVTVDSENTDLELSNLDGMTVTAEGMNFRTTCNVRTGEVFPGTSISDDNSVIIFKKVDGKYEYEAIVCPDVIPNDDSEVTFTLGNGYEYNWKIPKVATKDGTEPKEFESGNCYIYNLRLNGNSIIEAKLEAIFHDWNTVNEGDIPLGPNDLIK